MFVLELVSQMVVRISMQTQGLKLQSSRIPDGATKFVASHKTFHRLVLVFNLQHHQRIFIER